MWRRVLTGLALATSAATALAAGGAIDVRVSVDLIPTSGACGAVSTSGGFGVSCVRPGSVVAVPNTTETAPGTTATAAQTSMLPTLVEGATSYRLATVLPGVVIGTDPMPLYAGGVEITSWRTISLDNRSYVELTIAW